MAVIATDIDIRLSGGSSQSDPNLSLGGAKSSVEVNFAAILNNLFDNVSDSEALAGDVEYRCVYVHNSNGSSALTDAKAYITSNTPSADTTIAIGVDPAGVGNGSSTGVATTAANENTAPAGVTFSTPTTDAAALALGTLGAGQSAALWIRRTVTAGAMPVSSDPFTIRVIGTP